MPVRTTSQQVILNGRRLAYTDSTHDRGDNLLVFLHAYPLHSGMWAPQFEALPSGWRTLAPDFRGFGRSDADSDPGGAGSTLDDYALDVIRLLDDLGIERAVFCGLSMGGYTLLAILRRWPGRVSGIVLADTRATADSEAGRAKRMTTLDRLDREGPRVVAAEMLPGLLGETSRRDRPDVVRSVTALVESAGAAGIRHAVHRMMSRPDSTPLLRDITCPALIIAGEEDTLTPVADSRALNAGILGSSLAVIPGAGHLSNLESPGAFNAALNWFLGTAA